MRVLTSARRSDAVLAVAGIAVALVAGAVGAHSYVAGGALVGAILLLAVIFTRPVLLAVAAAVGVYASYRAGAGAGVPGGNGVAYSDVLLTLATAITLPSLANRLHVTRLRMVFAGLAFYLVCLLPTVLLDDSHRGVFEWVHRLVIVGGAVAVGYWIASNEMTRFTLRALFGVSAVVAVAAMANAVQNGFEPAYPLHMNKNFAGAQLSLILVVLVTGRRTHELGRRTEALLVVVLAGGLLATQSRGSMLAATAALLMVAAFSPRAASRRGRGAIALVTIVLAGFVYFSIKSQLSLSQEDLNNSSIGVRQQVEKRSHEIWRTSPIRGVGLKYFFSGDWGKYGQAPNIVVDNELAESGLIGLGGFVVLQGAAITAGVRRRRDSHMALVGAACVTGALVHGMVDIYWIGGSVALPFMLLGMGLGATKEDTPPVVPVRGRHAALERAAR